MKTAIAVIAYIAVGVGVASWNDALDRRCRPPAEPFIIYFAVGALWPVALPKAMASSISDHGRWSACKYAVVKPA